ncbi:MAG: SUMF1/EgtB/PvdO family nonheme iron enzyme, partial [Bacteroidetes bacterium]|nr:SUMF1/EgtB/PvdO family nonheme iron enzyme [Bacteroidota bacterium]
VKTSTDEYCASCHVHPHSSQSWKRSTHVDNPRGIKVHCVDCHLPPHGEGYLIEKAKTGIRDLWSNTFKDSASFNWEEKSQIEYAKHHSFEASCIHCHENNYPLGLTTEGREAHLYYEKQEGKLHCINCHITVGHYDPDRLHAQNTNFGITEVVETEIYTEPGVINGFNNFTEYVPGSNVSFEMLAIPGGSFQMGSPEDEPFRNEDEGPTVEVSISSFFMAKIEVTWDEYLAFFKQTGSLIKTTDTYSIDQGEVDGISGPTPPYGAPDQGWGKGKMPAITMTHHAAEVYCQWLSEITGKTYRLPTEAEWEYAVRGGTSTPYFFDGDPRRYVNKGIRNKLFGVDTTGINSFITYNENSRARSAGPDQVIENPFGLVNMLGNVAEFCADWYAEDAYAQYPEGIQVNPAGPSSGEERVVRGGSYREDAAHVRSASRDFTETEAWMNTDPQIPKSVWWYSDCFHVGFRVVCEYNEATINK